MLTPTFHDLLCFYLMCCAKKVSMLINHQSGPGALLSPEWAVEHVKEGKKLEKKRVTPG
jgi:hypothetical protein